MACVKCGCIDNSCCCDGIGQAPYYTDPCLQSSQEHCDPTYICKYSPVIRVQNSWAVPDENDLITLKVPALVDILIGTYIWNPTYGLYVIVSYDEDGQTIKVRKAEGNNVTPGTVIPSCTKFIVTDNSQVRISELEDEIAILIEELNVSNCCCWTSQFIAHVPHEADTLSNIIYRPRTDTECCYRPYLWEEGVLYNDSDSVTDPLDNLVLYLPGLYIEEYPLSCGFSGDWNTFYSFQVNQISFDTYVKAVDTTDIAHPVDGSAFVVDHSTLTNWDFDIGNSMAVDPVDGLLYFLYYTSTNTFRLATVDPLNGDAFDVGVTGITPDSENPFLFFDRDGNLYFVDNTDIHSQNKSTGAVGAVVFTTDDALGAYNGWDGATGYAFKRNGAGLGNIKFTIEGDEVSPESPGTDQGTFYAGEHLENLVFNRRFCLDSSGEIEVITITDRDYYTGEVIAEWPEGTTFTPA